uniref:Uncharacterized protein n=1 Tax=Anguilla anguilla TaxID=7936 RepID=A0A0E9WZ83_ANGAN
MILDTIWIQYTFKNKPFFYKCSNMGKMCVYKNKKSIKDTNHGCLIERLIFTCLHSNGK